MNPSDEGKEFSESGNPVYRHRERKKPFEPVTGDVAHIELIDAHIAEHLGKVDWVFHEIVSDLVHIDVHIVPPTPQRDFYTLVTSGMSARSMTTPEGLEEFSYAEVLLCLPPDWPLRKEDFEDERNYWPIRLLKTLARMPHELDTWLAYGHSVTNGDPAEPYAEGVGFCGCMLIPPLLAPDGFSELRINEEMSIRFLAVLPLYPEELDLKLKKGSEPLMDKLEKIQASELVEVGRRNVAKKRFGLF